MDYDTEIRDNLGRLKAQNDREILVVISVHILKEFRDLAVDERYEELKDRSQYIGYELHSKGFE